MTLKAHPTTIITQPQAAVIQRLVPENVIQHPKYNEAGKRII